MRSRSFVPVICLVAALVTSTRADAQTWTRYWGDLQGDNTGFGQPEEYYVFGRDSVALDFVALTPQATKTSATKWTSIKAAATTYNAPGSFVAFSGYEWNSDTYGHKAVYFLTDDQPLYKPNDPASNHPNEFFALMQGSTGIAHVAHPSLNSVTTNWNFHDSQFVLNAEIYSRWGQYETHPTNGKAMRDAWALGYRLGALGTSDTHTHPGIEGGLSAVLATSLTRDGIAEALRARRTYATTGARIGLDFSIGGATFGEIQNNAVGDARILASVEATAPISRIEVRRSNELVYSYAAPPQRVFVEVGDSHRFYRGQTAPPADWSAASFDDAGWESGRSGIGFGDDDDVTVITGMKNNYFTIYTRHAFTVTDNAPQYLFLGVDYDDGFIAYLDGVEVLRMNMPEGPVSYDTPAGPFREPNAGAMAVAGATSAPFYTDNGQTWGTPASPVLDIFDLSAYATLLPPGPHVLAIEVHNSLISSGDLTLIPQLYELEPILEMDVDFTDAGATGDRWYDVKVLQIDDETAWSSPIWMNPDAPERPTAALFDTGNDQGGSLELTWTRSNASDFRYYNIFVSDQDFTDASGMTPWNNDPITNQDSLAAQIDSFAGAPLERGKTYYVFVGAFDWGDKMNSDTFGVMASAAPVDNLSPSPPASVLATDTPGDDGGCLEVSWSLSPDDGSGADDVDRYEIFRRTSTEAYGAFPLHTRPAGTTELFDNTTTDGTEYYYRVRATDGFNLSLFSVEYGPVMSVNNGGLPEPTDVSATDRPADQGQWIVVDWDLIPQDAEITEYEIFRATIPGGYGAIPYGTVPSGTDTFEDSMAVDGTDYYYAVVADSAGVRRSAFSLDAGPVQALDNIGPAPLDSLDAVDNFQGGSVSLDWTGYDEAAQGDVASYDIYYKTRSFSTLGTLLPLTSVGPGTTMTVLTGLQNGEDYWFAVVPVDEAGNYTTSVVSNWAKPTDTTPPVFAGLTNAVPGDHSLTVRWTPAMDNSLPLTYRLFESLTPGVFDYSTPTYTFAGSRSIVALGDPWKYFKGFSSPPFGWNQRSFDDSSWQEGEGAFGYDNSGRYQLATTFDDMDGVYTSAFFRANFDLSEIPESLFLGILVDDGYVAYLNGVEVARYNLDDPLYHYSRAEKGTNAAWNGVLDPTSPTNYDPDPVLWQVDISAHASLLQIGTNTLAIQVHNYKTSNTDFLFVAELAEALNQYEITGLSPTQTYHYSMRAEDGMGNEDSNTAAVSGQPQLATPPAPVPGLQASKSGTSIALQWAAVSTDSLGDPLTPDHYNVYRGTAADFVPDLAGHTNLLASPTTTSFTDPGALVDPSDFFYRVTAVATTGRESYAPSALGLKVARSETFQPGGENVYWISIPYLTGMPNARTLVDDLNGGPTPGPVIQIQRFHPSNQTVETLAFDLGAWSGDNFALVAGESYAITLVADLNAPQVGAHNPSLGLDFIFSSQKSNIRWLALPYHADYMNAQSLLDHLNNGTTPTAVSKVIRFDPATGQPRSFLHFADQWLGDNFVITPGEGYGIVLRGDLADWYPRVR